MKPIYFDFAATTYVDPRVMKAMAPYWSEKYGNPSALHAPGREAKEAISRSRVLIAKLLNAKQDREIVFTGSGTESCNLAVIGAARAARKSFPKGGKPQILVSSIEHLAVLKSCSALETEGFDVSHLPVDKYGLVDPAVLARALRPETVLVSVMYANNEIGTVEPIAALAEVIRDFRAKHRGSALPYFHTDACQAAGALTLDVEELGVDLLSINGGKIYGPKGVGALYVRTGVPIEPLVFGGGQEFGLRSGTENPALIVGLAQALKICDDERRKESLRLRGLRDRLIAGLLKAIPGCSLNGHPVQRLPNNVHVSILGLESRDLVTQGLLASTGSACSSEQRKPSHVTDALGLSPEAGHGSLRLTLGRSTTKADIDYLLKTLPAMVTGLRKKSKPAARPAEAPARPAQFLERPGNLRLRLQYRDGGLPECLFVVGAARQDDVLFRRAGDLGLACQGEVSQPVRELCWSIVSAAGRAVGLPPGPETSARWEKAVRDIADRARLGERFSLSVERI